MLGRYNLTHKFDCGIVLTAITTTTSLHIDIAQTLRTVEPLSSVGIDIRIQLSLQWQAQQEQRKEY